MNRTRQNEVISYIDELSHDIDEFVETIDSTIEDLMSNGSTDSIGIFWYEQSVWDKYKKQSDLIDFSIEADEPYFDFFVGDNCDEVEIRSGESNEPMAISFYKNKEYKYAGDIVILKIKSDRFDGRVEIEIEFKNKPLVI